MKKLLPGVIVFAIALVLAFCGAALVSDNAAAGKGATTTAATTTTVKHICPEWYVWNPALQKCVKRIY